MGQLLAFKPILLWTDALFFLVLLLVSVALFIVARRPNLHVALVQIISNKRAVVALCVLSCFVLIGVLDSLHFQRILNTPTLVQHEDEAAAEPLYSVEIDSVLDVLLARLRHSETTYSAPFALTGFDRTAIEHADGSTTRDYPPLQYAGMHLASPEDKIHDIVITTLKAVLFALILVLILSCLFIGLYARKHRCGVKSSCYQIITRQTLTPWWLIGLVLGAIIIVLTVSIALSSDYHILGTDKVGEDVLYQTLKGVRTALIIGSVTTLVMLPFSLIFGMMAGYFKGWVDDAIQYLYTTLSSIPGILLIAALVLTLQVFVENNPEWFNAAAKRADIRLLALCFILGITSWTSLCRLLRGETLKVRELDYVQAARVLGVGHFKILLSHILPNIMYIVIITMALDFSGLVLAEAVLSYVGIGVDPASYSWGNMINQARLELAREPIIWWSLISAFVFMFVLVLAANILADAIRDAFDVRTHRMQAHGSET